MGGGNGSNNLLTTALLIIFAILFYVFWRRRTIHGCGDEISQISSPESNLSPLASSKGLLYSICGLGRDSEADDRNSGRQPEVEVIDIDLLKIQGMFGPPRFLFTIKEEEKEELESPAEKSLYAGSGKGGKARLEDDNDDKVCRVSLEERLKIDVLGGGVDDYDDDDATPFSTPCASPVYFTPLASPVNCRSRSTETAAFSRSEV